jgi:hypothetical protein
MVIVSYRPARPRLPEIYLDIKLYYVNILLVKAMPLEAASKPLEDAGESEGRSPSE